MKAAVRTRYGPPEVVQISEVEKPTITDNEVLVKVHATTVNRTDCGLRAAKPFIVRLFTGLIRPRATVLGCEFAGVVEAVGGRVTSFKVGDRVFGFSKSSFGAHAEHLSTPAGGMLATMPANVTFEEVVPSTEGSQYASRSSVPQRSGATRTSWSMARREQSDQQRSSFSRVSVPT